MKQFFTIAMALFVFSLSAQVAGNTNDVIIVKEVSLKKYTGRKFRIKIDMKSVPADETGTAALFTLQVGKSNWDFIDNSSQSISAAPNNGNWNTYTLEGTASKGVHKIWLYLHATGNGDFYFDNLEFEIEGADNTWTAIAVPNGNFEASSDPLAGAKHVKSKSPERIKTSLDENADPQYGQSLHIAASGGTALIAYGNNPASGKYYISNGTRLYYEMYGEGAPLVLLHGNGGSIASFAAEIPELAKKHRVIAIDTRGQGKSTDTVSADFTYNQFADDVKNLLDTLGLKQASIVGWSDGGNTGLILAMEHPEYVSKLVTMGANLFPTEEAVGKKMLSGLKKDIARIRSENNPDSKLTARLLELMLKEPNIRPEQLAQIKAAVLVMAGEHDIILEKHTRLIAGSIPGAQLAIMKGQTHMLPEENPVLFSKTVLDFLDR